jgi:hypothetical protein
MSCAKLLGPVMKASKQQLFFIAVFFRRRLLKNGTTFRAGAFF